MTEILKLFEEAANAIRDEFNARRNVLSYEEYLTRFATDPRRHLRDSARYLLDCIDYFGVEQIERPWGSDTRYKLFNQEFGDVAEQLVGQERAQMMVRDAVASQVRDGRVNRLVVIYGPNGSAKSTLIKCLFNGLDYYSRLGEGELFRFRWIFPTRKKSKGAVGFGNLPVTEDVRSMAYLEDENIDATLECEVRDHPLLLLPKKDRRLLIEEAMEKAGVGDYQIPDHFLESSLCHRCRQVVDALMRTYHGDIRKVLAHVQVERWAMSRRYRRGIVQLGPQMSADAGQRQITADRSLSALPIELQNMTLFETHGPLVDGSGGLVEFEDMLKRPIDAFKYLLGTIETGEVALGQSIHKLNTVLMATSNDAMLEAFRQHHEYPSFRDRLTMIPVPYLKQGSAEQRIYELQLVPHVDRHVAPHAVMAAAKWAVLTRLHKPNKKAYKKALHTVIENLTAAEKCDLYENGTVPQRFGDDEAALLREVLPDMLTEDEATWSYEGRYGASPRLIRQVLLNASLSDEYTCLSPFAVLEGLDDLCSMVKEHPFLERKVQTGGYQDHRAFVGYIRDHVLDEIESDVRSASGLVEESRYMDLMKKYVNHVSQLVKGEKVHSETTGDDEDPDQKMMESVEEKLGVEGDKKEFRNGIISRIAAWAIDNPKKKMDIGEIFPKYFNSLKDSYFEEHRQKVAGIGRFAFAILAEEDRHLDNEDKKVGQELISGLVENYGYCEECVKVGLAQLFSERFKNQS